MGKVFSHELFRALLVVGLLVGIIPVTAVTAAPPPPVSEPAVVPAARVAAIDDTLDPTRAARFSDPVAKLSLTPPAGWVLAPLTSLNPPSAPASPVYEVARFQLRMKDPALYAQPVPLTSGLLADAGAVLSVGVAREESELLELDIDPRVAREELGAQGGYITFDEDATYEGLVSHTRYFMARTSDRRLVMQAVVPAEDWLHLQPAILSAMRSLRADQAGPHGPVAPPPPPPPPAPEVATAAAEPPPDPSAQARFDILTRAKALLGTPYVWGGNSPNRAMDCSAYVSWAWGVARYTTDSIWAVSHHISKEELRPGDAMNLTIGNDPRRYGHIRIFEAWANEAHTLVWVYEETPPRAVHRVIAYDVRYQPIRLNGLGTSGPVPLVIAPPSAVQPTIENFGPAAAPRPAPRATPRPAVRATPRPTVRPTVRPTATRRPATPRPSATPRRTATPRPYATARPTATLRAATTATVPPIRTPTPAPTARP
ncbi:MAG TPA: NlpC/P60 family protein [Candidatus Limnocylindria bacterium]|nr:NlpC/P60 family protein [Candidatus Limnocylindria bacterium]